MPLPPHVWQEMAPIAICSFEDVKYVTVFVCVNVMHDEIHVRAPLQVQIAARRGAAGCSSLPPPKILPNRCREVCCDECRHTSPCTDARLVRVKLLGKAGWKADTHTVKRKRQATRIAPERANSSAAVRGKFRLH